ncbi:MAG: DUF2336 domain-containing protein [Pseudomonadota bacterium]|nr:DUF2336 domain-containing protein [Pseudomonadota bacterium]
MVPVEWPIAAPANDGVAVPPRVAGSGRLPVARVDFFLDPRARLTEQERSLMTAMLSDLVAMVEDELTSLLGDVEPANDEGEPLVDRLWAAGLLDIADLIRMLLQRAEEERVAAGIRAGRPAARMRLLQSLVSDGDPGVSSAAMALILACARRRDRFDGPRLMFDDLSAEAAVALVNATAAALRCDLSRRLGRPEADERLSAAAQTLLSRHDEGHRLGAKLFDVVHALERSGKLDDMFLRRALSEAEVALLAEALARRGGIDFSCAWDHLTGGHGKLALLLRLAGLQRDLAGEVIAAVADLVGSDAETEIQAFDSLGDEEVESRRKWLRLSPAYRDSIGALGPPDG